MGRFTTLHSLVIPTDDNLHFPADEPIYQQQLLTVIETDRNDYFPEIPHK